MSGLIVGLVLRTQITDEFNSDAKFIATVYADHAWDDGTHAYPAVPTVARITGIHERTIQRYLRVLEKIKMLIPDGKGPRGVNKYKFPVEDSADGFVRLALAWGGAVTPVTNEGGGADSGGADSGGEHWVTPQPPKQTNNPLIVIDTGMIKKLYEQEFGALTPLINDMLEDDCQVYPLDWIPEAMSIAVQKNVRNWKYVRAILDNCKAKNMRPSLNKLEDHSANTNNKSGNSKHTEKPSNYSPDDRAAAERVRQRKANRMPGV